MRKGWQDFLLSGLFVTLILSASLACAWFARPWTASWFGPYHVLVDTTLLFIGYGLLSACAVRALLKVRAVPLEKSHHQMDDSFFAYWKLLTVLYRLGQGALRWCTPFFARPWLDMLFGARIGNNIASGGTIDDPYMVTIGHDVVLGNASLVTGNYIDNGRLVCGPVLIGNHVTIGANAVILPNTVIGDGATVMSGALVGPNARVNPGEIWRGNPARKWTDSPSPAATGASSERPGPAQSPGKPRPG